MGKLERMFNPKLSLEEAPGDVDAFVPPFENLERDMSAWWRPKVRGSLAILVIFAMAVLVWVVLLWWIGVVAAAPLFIRDDGRYANSPLKSLFDQLASGKGLCCSFADGFSIQDVDWETRDGHYRVRLQGEWIDVPESAVVTEPNRFGAAVAWPYQDSDGATQIRCFMPGAGA